MLKLKGNYQSMIKSIHTQNIPKEWCYNMDYTMLRLIASMLSRYIKESSKIVLFQKEDLDKLIETKDMFCKLIKMIGEEADEKELEIYELKNKAFAQLSEILFMLWI